MIIDKLINSNLYTNRDSFMQAFDFLKTLNQDSKEDRYELKNGIYAVIESYKTKIHSEGRLEAHRKYIDIQMVLSGTEKIGWHNIEGLEIETPYNPDKDIIFYKSPKTVDSLNVMRPGTFMLLYPQDSHMPQLEVSDFSSEVKKVVVKIPFNSH